MKIKVTVITLAMLLTMVGAFSRRVLAYPELKASDVQIDERVWGQTNKLAEKELDKEGLRDGRIVRKNGRDFFSAKLKFVGEDYASEHATVVYCYSLELLGDDQEVSGSIIHIDRLVALYIFREGKYEISFKDQSAPCIQNKEQKKDKNFRET
jgi:hypothetical protein